MASARAEVQLLLTSLTDLWSFAGDEISGVASGTLTQRAHAMMHNLHCCMAPECS